MDNTTFYVLKEKTALLSAQLAVHHTLHNTLTRLLDPRGTLSELRLTKFIETLYGKPDNKKFDTR